MWCVILEGEVLGGVMLGVCFYVVGVAGYVSDRHHMDMIKMTVLDTQNLGPAQKAQEHTEILGVFNVAT